MSEALHKNKWPYSTNIWSFSVHMWAFRIDKKHNLHLNVT